MSNLDGTAISQIQNMAVASLSLDAVNKSLCPAVVLPSDFNVKSLEQLQEGRYRFRGAMDTTSIADFVKYSCNTVLRKVSAVLLMLMKWPQKPSSISGPSVNPGMLIIQPLYH